MGFGELPAPIINKIERLIDQDVRQQVDALRAARVAKLTEKDILQALKSDQKPCPESQFNNSQESAQ